MSLKSILTKLSLILFVLTILSLSGIYFYFMVSYPPVRDGKLFLKHAQSESTLLREKQNGIHHIRADNLVMASYTQGFAHA